MNFNQLFDSAYSHNLHQEPRKFVEFYDHNRILIEGQNLCSSSLIYDRVTRLISDYAHSLVHNESYTKAKIEIEKALKLLESHPDYQGQELLEVKYFETLLFDRAVVNYYAKNYKEALYDLSKLSKKFPDDEKFKNWLKATKSYKLINFQKVFYIVLAGALITNVFLDDMHPILDIAIIMMLAVSLLTIGVIEFIKWKIRKST